jgi:hypothetical protein
MDREHFDAFYEKDAIVGNRITKKTLKNWKVTQALKIKFQEIYEANFLSMEDGKRW